MSTFFPVSPRLIAEQQGANAPDSRQEIIAAASPRQEDDSWLCTILQQDRSPIRRPQISAPIVGFAVH